MAQIILDGQFTGGTGSVAWDLMGVNNTYHAHHLENTSFNSPLTLPPGLYNLILDGGCAGILTFNIAGNVSLTIPSVPDDINGNGTAFKRAYVVYVI